MPVGDNRGPRSGGGTYKAEAQFSIDPKTGQLSGVATGIGKTFGVSGTGGVYVSWALKGKDGSWDVYVEIAGVKSRMMPNPYDIDGSFMVHVTKDGAVNVSGAHDGFPSYEVWSYSEQGKASLVYSYKEHEMKDLHCGECVKVP